MKDRPNLILIDTDQQRADTIRAAGCTWMHTPNLDALSREGILFNNAFCCAATCVSSRAALYSALYPHTTGRWGFGSYPGNILWTHRLNEAGYRCFSIGKTHVTGGRHGFENRIGEWDNKHVTHWADGGGNMPCEWLLDVEKAGLKAPWDRHLTCPTHAEDLASFEWPLPTEFHPDAWMGMKANDWLQSDEVPTQEPFYLHIGFMGPHDPYDAPAEYVNLYDDANIPMPAFDIEERSTMPKELRRSVERMDNGPMSLIGLRESLVTPDRIRRMRKHYFANVSLIDEWIGKIVETLKNRGIWENSVLAFTSDHGDNLYDHSLFFKGVMYDTVMNVPLLVCGPGIRATGLDTNSLVSHMDLAQTLLDYAGAERNDREGISLRPLLEDGTPHPTEFVFAEEGSTTHRPEPAYVAMIRSRTHKYVHFDGGRVGQLFDLQNDPGERQNRWNDPDFREIRREMNETVLDWIMNSQYRQRNLFQASC
jgi:arylsulfatase A-like enzyme